MSIRSRGSRKVEVGEEVYAWTIRPGPTPAQAEGQGGMTVAIQRVVPPSRAVLMVDTGLMRCENKVHSHKTAVKPAMVRAMVGQALAEGWRPDAGEGHRLVFRLVRDRP